MIKMVKVITICLFSAILLLGLSLHRVFALTYMVPPPRNLQAAVVGTSSNDATVYLSWDSSQVGLGYRVTKIFPDGRVSKFTTQNGANSMACMMKGGFFSDPVVENNKTYTYQVQAFDGLLNFSTQSTITVTIHLGESYGCDMWVPLSLNASSNNLAINLTWENPDNKNFDIYLDDKYIKSSSSNNTKLWPIFGKEHTIKVVEGENSAISKLATPALAQTCINGENEQTTKITKNYSGFFANISKLIDGVYDKINF